jgi:hypothetical protein
VPNHAPNAAKIPLLNVIVGIKADAEQAMVVMEVYQSTIAGKNVRMHVGRQKRVTITADLEVKVS